MTFAHQSASGLGSGQTAAGSGSEAFAWATRGRVESIDIVIIDRLPNQSRYRHRSRAGFPGRAKINSVVRRGENVRSPTRHIFDPSMGAHAAVKVSRSRASVAAGDIDQRMAAAFRRVREQTVYLGALVVTPHQHGRQYNDPRCAAAGSVTPLPAPCGSDCGRVGSRCLRACAACMPARRRRA